MSEWGKVESKYGREVSSLKRISKIYSYDQKNANQTDKNMREAFISNLRAMKSTLTDLMSIAFKETDNSAEYLKKIRDDIDLATDEMKSLNYWKFPENQQALEKIVKADLVLLNSLDLMKKYINGIHTQLLSSQTSSGLEVKSENLRKMLNEFRAVFLERAEAIKIKG